MFGYPISFYQFLVLCFILYLLFGDPAFSWWLYKRRREDRMRARGFLPPLPVHPLLEIIEDLEYGLKQDIFSFKHYIDGSASKMYKSDATRQMIYDTDFKRFVTLEERLMHDYYIISDGIDDITIKLDYQVMSNIHLSSKYWSYTLSRLKFLTTYNIFMKIYMEVLFDRESEFQELELRIIQIYTHILQIQEDFRREHAEFIFEKDRVMRQLDAYKHIYNLLESKSRLGHTRYFRKNRGKK